MSAQSKCNVSSHQQPISWAALSWIKCNMSAQPNTFMSAQLQLVWWAVSSAATCYANDEPLCTKWQQLLEQHLLYAFPAQLYKIAKSNEKIELSWHIATTADRLQHNWQAAAKQMLLLDRCFLELATAETGHTYTAAADVVLIPLEWTIRALATMSNIVAVISLPTCLWPNTNRNEFVEDNRIWIKRGAQRSVLPLHANFLALHSQYMSSKNDKAAGSGDVLYVNVNTIVESDSKNWASLGASNLLQSTNEQTGYNSDSMMQLRWQVPAEVTAELTSCNWAFR